jgi:hypothetical protein
LSPSRALSNVAADSRTGAEACCRGAYEAGTRMEAAAPEDRERIFLELEA